MKVLKRQSVFIISLSLALIFSLVGGMLSSSFSRAANHIPEFTDVAPGQWYTAGIQSAYKDGVMTGTYYNPSTGDREFSPYSPLTMAEWTVMIVRAWYADELAVSTVPKNNWFNREAAILQNHGIYDSLGTSDTIVFYTSVTRTQMVVTIANLMKDKGLGVSASDIAAAKALIPDLSTIPAAYQDSAAVCYHLGILTGKDGGAFCGEQTMERREAATVYLRVKNALASDASVGNPDPGTSIPPTSMPANTSPVGTISAERVTINADSVKTHAPITDYWSQQPMDIRNISDRDSFNAACQTIKDSDMILHQGEIGKGLSAGKNLYYNYAVAASISTQTQKNVDGAMGALSGFGGSYRSYGSNYDIYLLAPFAASTTSAPRFASTVAQTSALTNDVDKATACVNAVCAQLNYVVDGGASWDNGGTAGDCTSYSRMLAQLLSAAGIPSVHVATTVRNGEGHAWVQARLNMNGSYKWVIMDAVSTDAGRAAMFSFDEHAAIYSYDVNKNNTDSYKVARALIDAAYPTN